MKTRAERAGLGALPRIATWLALAYGAAVAGLQLGNALAEGEADAFLLSLFFVPWAALPVAAAAMLAAASPTRLGAGFFLALEAGLILSVPLLVSYGRSHLGSVGGSFALLAWPLVQLAAIFLLFLPAYVVGWRMRPDFLRDGPAESVRASA